MTDTRPIGIFDSGLGGLTVLRAIAARLPAERLVYLGDTARVPYGAKSPETVSRYAIECAAFLCKREIKALVVACNTASALAMEALRDLLRPKEILVLGVIEPGAVEACRLSVGGRVGVVATPSTVRSNAYANALNAIRPDFTVVSRPCPMFVPLAEEGWTSPDDPVALAVAARYLAPLVAERVDTLILGCTHYPILRGVIEAALTRLGWEATLVDSAEAVARDLARLLASQGREASPSGVGPAPEYFVTDDPSRFREVGARFLGQPIEGPHLVDLERNIEKESS